MEERGEWTQERVGVANSRHISATSHTNLSAAAQRPVESKYGGRDGSTSSLSNSTLSKTEAEILLRQRRDMSDIPPHIIQEYRQNGLFAVDVRWRSALQELLQRENAASLSNALAKPEPPESSRFSMFTKSKGGAGNWLSGSGKNVVEDPQLVVAGGGGRHGAGGGGGEFFATAKGESATNADKSSDKSSAVSSILSFGMRKKSSRRVLSASYCLFKSMCRICP
jgi:hypothetical protein